MKTLTAAAVALLLAGCASAPKPAPPKKAPIVKVAPVETPNKVVKRRFCDGFMARWCFK